MSRVFFGFFFTKATDPNTSHVLLPRKKLFPSLWLSVLYLCMSPDPEYINMSSEENHDSHFHRSTCAHKNLDKPHKVTYTHKEKG